MGNASHSEKVLPSVQDVAFDSRPSFVKLANFANQKTVTTLTTPAAQGGVLSVNGLDGSVNLGPIRDDGTTAENQLWRMADGNMTSCYDDGNNSREVSTPYFVYNNNQRYLATNSSHTPNTFIVTTGDGEQNSYNENTGTWCHWNCNANCRNWNKSPKDKNAVCASGSQGAYGLDSKTNPTNVQDCKWITLDDAYKCCMLEPHLAGQQFRDQCFPSYIPNSSGGVCPDIMTKYCSLFWTKNTPSNAACNKYFTEYQQNPNDVKKVAHDTVMNFLLTQSPQGYKASRDGPGGANYKFFSQVFPMLASVRDPTNSSAGPCDDILDYYCRGFTRQDLQGDTVLQMLCGCHMLSDRYQSPDDVPVPKNSRGYCLDIPVTTNVGNQYIYGTVECDPLCNYSNVIPNFTRSPCKQTQCIIDNVNIKQFNSTGDVNIGIACGSCEGKGGTCSCYISNVDVNEFNTNGRVTISQNCGKCFTFDNNDISTAQEVDCSSLNPSSFSGDWTKWIVGIVLAVFGLLLLVLFVSIVYIGFSSTTEKSTTPSSSPKSGP
jgi:hypothetical protein